MSKVIGVEEFLSMAESYPVIDVRSPAEFEKGHIPSAYSIPIFSNDERAVVGINYKKNGKETAIINGLEIVGSKLADFVREAKKIAKENTVLVHCWRGGMRSASMAWLFETAGMKVFILEKGYKNYRHWVRSRFDLAKDLKILGGYTGSGKTEILKEMANLDAQFLDLEGIAHHKGSAFGAIGQNPQPTTEQFENNLAQKMREFDLDTTIWLEDESRRVGRCTVPDNLYERMRNTFMLKVVVPKKLREKRLVKEYGCFPKEPLAVSIKNIERRLGGLRAKQALEALENDELQKTAEITLDYYDKAYLHGNSKRNQKMILTLEVEEDNPAKTAKKVLDFVKTIN